jgi:hypothetical protein
MHDTTTILLLTMPAVLLTAIIALWIWHRKEIRRKNRGLFRHIDREHKLEEAIRREKIEKEALMKVIKQLTANNECSR